MRSAFGVFLVLISATFASKDAKDAGLQTEYQPSLVMHCGKCTQHRDVETGEWISDQTGSVNCIEDKTEILNYCKQVYPLLTITNILEQTENVPVPSWCHIGSTPPCRGHGHKVKPVTCVVGEYKPQSLEVEEGCVFEHTHDYDACHPPQYWEDKAAAICQMKGKTVSKPQVLKSCAPEVDEWQGVQFLCCDTPSLPKPKQNKGKAKAKEASTVVPTTVNVVEPVSKKTSINPICQQPKKIGLCRALLPAWHFNFDTNECEFFHYGGCGGNDNNFDARKDCEAACDPGKSANKPVFDDRSICGLPQVAGACLAYFERYHYDVKTQECNKFVFGGCMGNDNNFNTEEDCVAFCKGYKNPVTGSMLIKPQFKLPNLLLGAGPVLLNEHMEPVQYKDPTKGPDPTTEESSTTISSEHNDFADKFNKLKEEHQDKVSKILAQWDETDAQISPKNKARLDQSKEDLQQTIATLEDEYDDKMKSLNQFHMNRMNQMIYDARSTTLQRFLNQLKSSKPKLRHILASLEKYIAVERQDKTHVMQHYYMAINDDFDETHIPDFKNRINEIDSRVNKTRTVLKYYPDILSNIEEDVEDILSRMPESPDFDLDMDEDYEDEDLVDEEVIEEPTTVPNLHGRIDAGGIPDNDVCTLAPVVGPCRASILSFYYDPSTKSCRVFYYGGCGGNDNNFFNPEECQSACPGKSNQFSTIDINGVLDSEDKLPVEEEFDADDFDTIDENGVFESDDKLPEEEFDVDEDALDGFNEKVDDNDIFYSIEDDLEDESELDAELDSKFTYNGDLIRADELDIIDIETADRPQALMDQYNTAEMGKEWPIWVGLGVGVLFIAIVIAVVVSKRSATRPPMKIVVEKPEEDDKELSPEEKQLLALQQNGYENPTYKFFEKQMA